ncbi:MAG: COG4223 family protein [Bdellovibrionales bacterium]
MSKNAIENAQDIIEAFGGIRPMAKKIDVAVTTVQGWKKRNVIPASRRELIVQAAVEHNVDLDGLISGAIANQNDEQHDSEGDVLPEVSIKTENISDDKTVSVAGDVISEKTEAPSSSEKKILEQHAVDSFDQPPVGKGLVFSLIVALMIALGFGAVAAYFWQKSNAERAAEVARVEAQRIADLEAKLAEVESEVEESQGFLGRVIPKDLGAQIEGLKEKTQDLQADVTEAAQIAKEKAVEVSNDVLAENAGNIEERLTKLEGHIKDVADTSALAGMLERLDVMQTDPNSGNVLANTVKELDALFSTLQTDAAGATDAAVSGADDMINSSLDAARQKSTAIGQTFEAVPQDELKAAAMLLGMSQLRAALNRDNAAFDNDLSLLRKVAGEDNPELMAALDKLAPHAQDGVLTPSGLSNELRSFAGEAVAASLAGEDVSVKERAKARMNELLQIEKDGELVTGTDTQAAIVVAEQKLQNGDIAAAISAVEGLNGPAADAMLPWLNKARASLNAQDISGLVDSTIQSVSGAGGKLIRNEDAGINIYVPNKNKITY